MYFVAPFSVPDLDGAHVEPQLARALDPDVRDTDRIVALHVLRGAPAAARAAVARRLVPILNEPLHFVPCEALLVVDALAPSLRIGVDAHGALAACDTPDDGLVDDGDGLHCPVLGPVVTAREIDLVARAPLPWLARRPARLVADVDGVRRTVPVSGALPLGDRVSLRFRGPDALAVARAGPLVVNGVARAHGITVTRVAPGDVVEDGAVRARIVRVDGERSPDGRFRVVGPGVDLFLGVGEAAPVGDGHIVGLGAAEVGLVVAGEAARFSWSGAGARERSVGIFADSEVLVRTSARANGDVVRLGPRYGP